MNDRRYRNGVRWLNSNEFAANDDEPCYQWVKAGVVVCFDSYFSEWCAYATFNAGWLGDYCATPKSALSALRRSFEQARDSLLKQVKDCSEAIECLDKINAVK